jgi:hypothetical protein
MNITYKVEEKVNKEVAYMQRLNEKKKFANKIKNEIY